MTSIRVPNLLPSASGFAFSRSWPHNPIRRFKFDDITTLSIGDAANGLWGRASLQIWDPNFGRDCDVVLRFHTADPWRVVTQTWNWDDPKPVCFFSAPSAPSNPAPFGG